MLRRVVHRRTMMVALYWQCCRFKEEFVLIIALVLFVASHASYMSKIGDELRSRDKSQVQIGEL